MSSMQLECTVSSFRMKHLTRRPSAITVLVDWADVTSVNFDGPSHKENIEIGNIAIAVRNANDAHVTVVVELEYDATTGQGALTKSYTMDIWDLICDGVVTQTELGDHRGIMEFAIVVTNSSLDPTEDLQAEPPRNERPSLTRIRMITRQLKLLLDSEPHIVKLISTLLGYVWTVATTRFPNPSQWLRERAVCDLEGQPVDPMQPRYVATHDMLGHIRDVIDFLLSCREAYSDSTWLGPMGHDLLRHVVSATALVYFTVDVFYGATYANMIGKERLAFNSCYRKLLYLRIRIVSMIFNDPLKIREPPDNDMNNLLTFTYLRALQELRPDLTWTWSSYTAALMALRGSALHVIIKLLSEQIKATQLHETKGRDLLRRLLAHIVLASDESPRHLRLASDRLKLKLQDDGSRSLIDRARQGAGSYSDVFRGTYELENEEDLLQVAFKSLRFQDMGDIDERTSFRKKLLLEVVHMSTLQHKNVLQFVGITFDYGPLTLVSRWMTYSDARRCLAKYIEQTDAYRDRDGKPSALFNLSNRWISQVARGLQYLHTEGIAHGDLRGVNVLINSDMQAVIADFGLSVFAGGHSGNYNSRRAGHILWTAPEIWNPAAGERRRPTLPSDIFSFAMVCIELYTAQNPLHEPGQIRPARPSNPGLRDIDQGEMSEKLWSVVQQCWHEEPTARPNADILVDLLGAGYPNATT